MLSEIFDCIQKNRFFLYLNEKGVNIGQSDTWNASPSPLIEDKKEGEIGK